MSVTLAAVDTGGGKGDGSGGRELHREQERVNNNVLSESDSTDFAEVDDYLLQHTSCCNTAMNRENAIVDDESELENVHHFTSEWVVRVKQGKEVADRVAFENGYENIKQVSE